MTSLLPYNTFGFDISAQTLLPIHSEEHIQSLVQSGLFKNDHFILGGGSNVLFTSDYPGTVLLNQIAGKEIKVISDEIGIISFGSGEQWHECVLYSIEHGYSGIENLSLIPGSIGAAPIQNIGAYGVELKDVFHSLQAINLHTGALKTFHADECEFGYRDSIFKREEKGNYFITKVQLRLSKKFQPNISYGNIKEQLSLNGIDKPTAREVSNAVIQIRQTKLPDPRKIGNGGSFFKNPIITEQQFKSLKEEYSEIPSYPAPDGIKIPAGWLIEQTGWKGFKKGTVGVHQNQALVLVHFGGGKGIEIKNLSKEIQQSVFNKYHIHLEPEVNIVGIQ